MTTDQDEPPESGRSGVRELRRFSGSGYDKGRSIYVQACWFAVLNLVFTKWWCPAKLRVLLLRAFGARIGTGVHIRHRVRVHWPWRLEIGNDCWIGEGAWLLNLLPIRIGSNVCISQEAMLVTGSHDRRSPTFEFDNAPIDIEEGAWIAARGVVLRGVRIGRNATVGANSVASVSVDPGELIFAGPMTIRKNFDRQ